MGDRVTDEVREKKMPCPLCGKKIRPGLMRCPKCAGELVAPRRSLSTGGVFVAVLAALIVAGIVGWFAVDTVLADRERECNSANLDRLMEAPVGDPVYQEEC